MLGRYLDINCQTLQRYQTILEIEEIILHINNIKFLKCKLTELQWNPVNTDTKGTCQSVRIIRCPY